MTFNWDHHANICKAGASCKAEALPSSAPKWTYTQADLCCRMKSALQANRTGVLYKQQRHVSGQSGPAELPLTYMMNGLINHSHLSLVASLEVSNEILFCIVANTPLLSVSSSLRAALCCRYQIFPLKTSQTLKGRVMFYVCVLTQWLKSRPVITRLHWSSFPPFLFYIKKTKL